MDVAEQDFTIVRVRNGFTAVNTGDLEHLEGRTWQIEKDGYVLSYDGALLHRLIAGRDKGCGGRSSERGWGGQQAV